MWQVVGAQHIHNHIIEERIIMVFYQQKNPSTEHSHNEMFLSKWFQGHPYQNYLKCWLKICIS